MNIETEMIWNSYMMKSGKVFGTYEFMIAKGHSWNDINYVVWDIEDDTGIPLVKAVASALNTHPDLILKDVAQQQQQQQQPQDMRTAVNQQQVDAYNQRMAGQQTLYDEGTISQTPKPTGGELWQAKKPAQAVVASLRNLVTGGDYSRGGNVDAQAGSADGMKERYRLRDKLNPFSTGAAMAGQLKDKWGQGRAAQTIRQNQDALNRLTYGRDRDTLSPEEQVRYDELVGRKVNAQNTLARPDMSRTVQDRKKDAANKRWRTEPPGPSKKPNPPYPLRQQFTQGQPSAPEEEFEDNLGESISPEEAAEIEQLGEGIDPHALDDSPPPEEEGPEETTPTDTNAGPPEPVEAETGDNEAWKEALPFKRGRSKRNWENAIESAMGEDGTIDEAGLRDLVKNFRGTRDKFDTEGNITEPAVKKEEIIQAVLATFPGQISPEKAEEIVEEEFADDLGGEKPVVAKPAAKKAKVKAAEKPVEEEVFEDDLGEKPKPKKKKAKKADEIEIDESFDDEVMSSNDEAMNFAWDHLTVLKSR